MGLILDSSFAIQQERQRIRPSKMIADVLAATGTDRVALSTVSLMELEHGVWRARDATREMTRRTFIEELIRTVPALPVTVEIARLAGAIGAQLAEKGVIIGTADLLIGATALDSGFSILTMNFRHFRVIPGLEVVTL